MTNNFALMEEEIEYNQYHLKLVYLKNVPSIIRLLERDLFVLPQHTLPASHFTSITEYSASMRFLTTVLLFLLFPKLRTCLLILFSWLTITVAHAGRLS